MQILPVPGLEVRADSTFKICLKVHENNKEHLHRFKLNSSTRQRHSRKFMFVGFATIGAMETSNHTWS